MSVKNVTSAESRVAYDEQVFSQVLRSYWCVYVDKPPSEQRQGGRIKWKHTIRKGKREGEQWRRKWSTRVYKCCCWVCVDFRSRIIVRGGSIPVCWSHKRWNRVSEIPLSFGTHHRRVNRGKGKSLEASFLDNLAQNLKWVPEQALGSCWSLQIIPAFMRMTACCLQFFNSSLDLPSCKGMMTMISNSFVNHCFFLS